MVPDALVRSRLSDESARLVAEARRHVATSAALVQESMRLRKQASELRAASFDRDLDRDLQRIFGARRPPLPSRPPRVRAGATVAPGRRDARPASRVIDVGPRRPAPARP